MGNLFANIGMVLKDAGLEELPALPGEIHGVPNHVVVRMHWAGVITKHGASRQTIWQHGPHWPKLKSWWDAHESI